MGLHGYETAVRFLREQAWPDDAVSRAVLDLFYAHSLVSYTQIYSWEIRGRERVASDDEVDLKRWTLEQIVAEANRAFGRVWAERAAWGESSIGELARYIDQNDYPPRIRGTLRDAVSYLWVELLADSSLWRPGQSNELYQLDVAALIAGDPAHSAALDLADPRVHPLAKIGAVLDDLEAWHGSAGRPEAALEARLERLRRLHAAFAERPRPARRPRPPAGAAGGLRPRLRVVVDGPGRARRDAAGRGRGGRAGGRARGKPWPAPSAIRTASAASAAATWWRPSRRRRSTSRRWPSMPSSAARSASPTATSRPSTSGPTPSTSSRRSRGAKDYNLLPGYREVPEWIDGRQPVAAWTVELPATPDFRDHASYVDAPHDDPWRLPGGRLGPPRLRPRSQPDVRVQPGHRRPRAAELARPAAAGRSRRAPAAAACRSPTPRSPSTAPTGGAATAWSTRSAPASTASRASPTSASGRTSTSCSPAGRTTWPSTRASSTATTSPRLGVDSGAFLYTDRSRLPAAADDPLEGGGLPGRRRRAALPHLAGVAGDGHPGRRQRRGGGVPGADDQRLRLGLGQLRRSRRAGCSGPGTLRSSLGGATSVRVEEYKRPTFEVTVDDPEQPLRLNRPAALAGEARYYFGLPVTRGRRGVAGHPRAGLPALVVLVGAGAGDRGRDRRLRHRGARRRRPLRDRLHAGGRRARRGDRGHQLPLPAHGRRHRRGRRDPLRDPRLPARLRGGRGPNRLAGGLPTAPASTPS